MASKKETKSKGAGRPATRLVHEGTLRSQFGETSEAIFLNSGYVYDSAEQAEARFKGDEEGFVYSLFSNPTVSMLGAGLVAARGSRGWAWNSERHGRCRCFPALFSQGRRPCRFGPCVVRRLPLCRRGSFAALRHRVDTGGRA